jgi:hypothetical protein
MVMLFKMFRCTIRGASILFWTRNHSVVCLTFKSGR